MPSGCAICVFVGVLPGGCGAAFRLGPFDGPDGLPAALRLRDGDFIAGLCA